MKNDFYTYAYLREDGTPYYVGKGRGKRAFSRARKGTRVPPRERILFLKKNLTEKEAFRHEVYMIAVLGRKDLGTGILRNRTGGGEGTSGVIRSEKWKEAHRKPRPLEVKRKISETKMGHEVSPETRRKISEGRKGKGCRPCSEETKAKIGEANRGHNRPWSELRWKRHRERQEQKKVEEG